MKTFCSIGTQTDDSLCSDDIFEGMIPYRKPILQEIQINQTPNVCVSKSSNVQIQKEEKGVQIRNLFLKPRNKKRRKKRKNKSKMEKVWMPKIQVHNACGKVHNAEVKNVQRKFHSHFSSDEYSKSWRKEKRVLFSVGERFSLNKWVCKKSTPKLNLKWVPNVSDSNGSFIL